MAKVFVAAFAGKIVAAIFIAICIALGFGPKEWAAMILGVEPTLFARGGFLVLALIAAVVLAWPFVSPRFLKKLPEAVERAGTHFRAGATVTMAGQAIPAAKYSKAQINRILEAIDAFYPPLVEIEQIMISGTWIAGSLEAIIRDKGAAELLAQMDQLRLKLIDPSDRLDGELRKFSLYTEICRVLDEKKSQHEAFFAAFNELADILRQIPDRLSAPALAIFVEAKKATFIARTASYLFWAQQKKKALAEYREWYLRRPTTD